MKKYIIGKRVSLHGLTEEELNTDHPYYHWLDDLSLDLFTTRSYFPNSMERMQSYYKRATANNDILLLGIYDNSTAKHIGNITLQDINWINQTAFIAYMLGDKSFAGKGVTTDAAIMTMYYGFNKLNLERIWGGVVADHKGSARVCEKIGLKIEGRMRGQYKRNGERFDSLIVGALRDEWMESHGETARKLFEELPI